MQKLPSKNTGGLMDSKPTERGQRCEHGILWPHECRDCFAKLDGTELTSSGGECVGCGRIMSVRERNEQGVCDGCATGER